MTFFFHPEAETELNEAIEYYEAIEPALGYDFALEIYYSIQRAVSFPKAWPIIEGDIRRSMVNRFPYGVLYSIIDNTIHIIAIMHLHRHPEYWKKRK